MANYDMGASPAAEGRKEPDSKKISFRFCQECSNMLYPKEDRLNNKLMFACRTCQYSEEAVSSCIYRNSLKETIAETPGNVQDVAQDPTMAETAGVDVVPDFCTFCGEEILCPICEQPTDRGIMLETEDPSAEIKEKGDEVIEQEKRERTLSSAGLKSS